jgi:hypothetical protein
MVERKLYCNNEVMAVVSDYGTLAIPLDDVIQALGSFEFTRYWEAIKRLEVDYACYDVPLLPRGTVKMVDRAAVVTLLEDEGTPLARAFADWLDAEFPQPSPPSADDLLMTDAQIVASLMVDEGEPAEAVIEALQIPANRGRAVAAQAAILYGQMCVK